MKRYTSIGQPQILSAFKPAPAGNFGYSGAWRLDAVSEYAYTDPDGNSQVMDLAVTGSSYPIQKIHTVNITDPYNPEVLGVVKDSSGNEVTGILAMDVSINKASGLVFVAASNGVYVIDIKDPRNPQLLNILTQAPDSTGAMLPLGASSALVEKDGWVYSANQQAGLKTVNFSPEYLKLQCADPAYPNAKLRCTDYYPALGEKTIMIEGRNEAMQLLSSGKLRFISSTPNAPTMTVSSKIIGDTSRAPFNNGYAKFYVKADTSYTGPNIVLNFRLEPEGQQLINTTGGAANTLGVTLKVRNNSNVTLAEALSGEAVFTYDAVCDDDHKGKTTNITNDKKEIELDFVQKMINHIMVPLRTYITQENMINTMTVDGCYGAETRDALNLIMNGGTDPTLTNSSIIATKVSHHSDDANSLKTFKKLVKDYSLNETSYTSKVIDKEILVGVSQKATDKHPTQDTDIGILELYENDDWDGDGLSNYVEVENGIDPLMGNSRYTTPANANNPTVSVERGIYTNGLLHGGLRIANVDKGYYYFKGGDTADTDNYATLRALQIIEAVAKEWERLHPDLSPLKRDVFANGDNTTNLDNNDDDGDGVQDINVGTEVRVGIGDMSLQNGGYWSDHASHQNGLDMDVRYIRSDNKEDGLDLQSNPITLYSQEFTRNLVELFKQWGARLIIVDPNANIPEEPGRVSIDTSADPDTGLRTHRHHMHVRFHIENNPTGTIGLIAMPPSIRADGSSTTTITSDVIRDRYGFPLIEGIRIRVRTDKGTINGQTNIIIPVGADGEISVVLTSDTDPGTATITVTSIDGNASGSTTVDFVQ